MKIELLHDFLKEDFKSKVVKSTANKISGSLSSKRNKDIGLIVRLSVYLYVLGKSDYACELLECIFGKVEFDENNRTLWGAYGDSLPLLAELQKDELRAAEICSVLDDQDIIGGCRREYYEEYTNEDHLEDLATARLESQKYRCEIYAGAILQLLYFKHMLKSEDEKYFDSVQEYLISEIEACKNYLRDSLLDSHTERS